MSKHPVLAFRRAMTIPGMRRDISAIAVMVVVAVAVTIGIMLNLSTGLPWETHKYINIEFEAVPGVNPGAGSPVTMAGIDVGVITGATTTDRGTAILNVELHNAPTVYSNARAVLRPKNPVNEMAVEINPGGPPGQPLGEHDVLPASQTARPIQADEVLGKLDGDAQAALSDLLVQSDTALVRGPQDFAPGLNATTDTAVAVRPVMEALRTRREKISQLVSSISQIAGALGQNTERTARLADGAQQTLHTLAANDQALKDSLGQLPGLSAGLRDALTQTQDLTKQLNPTLDDLNQASDALPPALKRLEKTTGPLNDLVDEARPVADHAKSVVRDLRPLAKDVDDALDDFLPVTKHLDRNTMLITSYLTEIDAFIYNTKSVFGNADAQGPTIRGHFVYPSFGGYTFPQPGFVPNQKVNPAQSSGQAGANPHGGN
jgi:phospholipid/cholesterol/gamma-HCH transport system substrate-binding protein